MFGFAKQLIDYPPSVDKGSHRLNHVNFFCPWVFVLAIKPNIVEDVHVQYYHQLVPVICCLCYFQAAWS